MRSSFCAFGLRAVIAFVGSVALGGCGMMTVRAEDVVRAQALRDIDCADLELTRGAEGSYDAHGCGRAARYVCDRDVGTGFGKPAAVGSVGCRRLTKRQRSVAYNP